MRKTTALIAAIALLGSLTACASSTEASIAGCDRSLTSGAASSVVAATGKFGAAPKVTFPTPLYSATSQVSTIIAGTGAPIGAGQPVILEVTILNGANGTPLQTTSYNATGGSLITAGKSAFPAVSLGLECAQVGSRIAIVGSAKDSHGGTADATNGIGKNDSFVYVVDVKDAFLAKADGDDQIPVNGMPAVVLTAEGTPGISVPASAAPKTAKVNVLKKGSGETVKSEQFVAVKYTAIGWGTKTVFDSTWTDRQASILQVGTASVSTGLSTALIGQTVGSQVLAVLPPKAAATADGAGKAPTDDAAVYVVDILGIAG
ncbi:FKBP-type peptidyl-prolyl cis-trans isomerase [Frigoribacterium sp. CG_9.8]|uniref:FKBP-type peptidyl-prolyl cis-trans isomerase n=1 Tax=Frigoribacterium sp. CG_9.8 TaxID=2787733 RepID=UPI0018CB8E0A|nr:peptidylprolyl isomerase [Frigoribacterium sp. CG_9.8]